VRVNVDNLALVRGEGVRVNVVDVSSHGPWAGVSVHPFHCWISPFVRGGFATFSTLWRTRLIYRG